MRFRLREDAPWAEAGHEVAWASFPLREDVANAFDGDADSALEVAEDGAELKILTDTLALAFDKDTGASHDFVA